MMEIKKIIIIPDVHGRDFWREPVEKYKNNPEVLIIFLGDYLDAYPFEWSDDIFYGLDTKFVDKVISEFTEIIDHARESSNIKLLLGNHDLHYFPEFKNSWGCRRYDRKFDYISGLFQRNLDLFSVTHEVDLSEKKYLFSHAGILVDWYNSFTDRKSFGFTVSGEPGLYYSDIMGYSVDEKKLLNISLTSKGINSLISTKEGREALAMVSRERGGSWNSGSCMWADVHEHFRSALEKVPWDYQVFGHTLTYPDYDESYIGEDFAMLDSRRAYVLDCETLKITKFSDLKPEEP